MKIVWTEQAKQGWQEVAAYILRDFGRQGFGQFKQRTKESETFISKFPKGCEVAWTDEETGVEYRWCTIYHRSKMLYFVYDEQIFIADFWDVRSNR